MRIAGKEPCAGREHRHVQRGACHQFLAIEIACKATRWAAAAILAIFFRWLQGHYTHERRQRNFHAITEYTDISLQIKNRYMRGRLGSIGTTQTASRP